MRNPLGLALAPGAFFQYTATMSITLAQISAIATTIIAVALSVLMLAALPALWRLRQAYRKLDAMLARLYADVTPIANNAQAISENINYVTTAIRQDIQKVSATIDAANARVADAMAMSEQRVREFNALLAVAQEEAEQLFVSTASTVRGVRRGADALRRRSGPDFASDELDAAGEADDSMIQEEGDGDDSNSEPAAQALPAAPRIRPRAGNRRRSGGRT